MRIPAIAILAASIALMAAMPVHADGPVVLDRIVAVAGNDAITWLELYDNMKRELGGNLASLSPEEQKKALKENEAPFLDVMVKKKLQMQEAARLGITADDRDVDQAIAGIEKKNNMTEDEFIEAIAGEGYTWQGYRDEISEQLVMSRLIEREVRSRIRKSLPAASEAPGETRYALRQIFLRTEGRTGEELRAMLAKITDRLRAGDDFGDMAARYSEGPAAQMGGDIGTIRAADLSEDFRRALEGLGPGQVSAPFVSNVGVHILQVMDIMSPSDEQMDKAFRERYSEWLRELEGRYYVSIRL